MKKFFNNLATWQLIALTVIAAGIVGFSVSFATAYNKSDQNSNASCAGTCVSLLKDKALPNTIAITKGSFVQFNSADGNSHSLSLGGGGEEHAHTGKFSSGEFKKDEAWRVQFTEDGTYTFHDHYNPKTNIVVVVYTAGKQYKVE